MNSSDATFQSIFDVAPQHAVTVPGRVNLIGEHIDYTGGTVLPMPIGRYLTIRFRPEAAARLEVYSTRFGERVQGPVDRQTDDWAAYVFAGHRKAMAEGLVSGGGLYFIDADLPNGAGVSSSAALLVAQLRLLCDLAGRDVPATTIATWAQAVENDDIGVPCGIMDQMAVAVGEAGKALALNTHDLSYKLIDLPTDYVFPVFHSGLTRRLTDGGYASRRAACEAAAQALSVDALSLIDDAALARLTARPDDIFRRARHAVYEHRRVLEAIAALREGDMGRLGRLMDLSHASMRDDFEIVPAEMDDMCADARCFGALGARLTGGGFGGCFVSLVPVAEVGRWADAMQKKWPGARVVSLGV